MNRFLEDMFHQYPFLYKIKDDYYIFGQDICKCYCNHVLLLRYEEYEKALDDENEEIAIETYVKIRKMCKAIENMNCNHHPYQEFLKYSFGQSEIESLREQVEIYRKMNQKAY